MASFEFLRFTVRCRGGAFRTDCFEEEGRRLVARILIDELSLERPLKDGLTQPSSTFLGFSNGLNRLGNYRFASFEFSDGACLLGERSERN